MKRLMLMAAAMTLGTAGLAQDTTGTTQPTQPIPPTTAPMPDPATAAPADAGTMQSMQNDPAMTQPPQVDLAQPAAPPAMTQPMTNDGNMATQAAPGTMSNMSAMMQPRAATGPYPRCSRAVTDRCTQIRGRAPR